MAIETNTSYHVPIEDVIDICKREGESFGATVEVTLAASATLETFFVTGSRPVAFYSRKISYDGNGVDTAIYRDATYTGGSTTIETFSSNDIIQKSARSYFVSGATTIDGGTQTRQIIPVFGNTSNQGNGALLESIDEELKMKPNSIYRFVITSRDTNNPQQVASVVSFCEPREIPGIVLSDSGELVRYSGKLL